MAKNETLDVINELGSAFTEFKEKYNARLDSIEAASNRSKISPNGAPADEYETRETGRAALTRGQSFAKYIAANDGEAREQAEKYRRDGVTLGALLKGMIMGPSTPAIKAALNEGTDSAGGFTVPVWLSAEFIDRLRAKMRCVQSGARTIPLTESFKTNIARLTGDVAPTWRAEAGSVTESDAVFDQVAFIAKSLAGITRVSRELMADSLNIEQVLERSIAQSFALEMDRVAIRGSGAGNEPRGIVNTTGVGAIASAANGDAITNWSKLVTAKQMLLEANTDAPYSALMSPRSEAKFGGLLDTTNQPLARPGFLDDVTLRSTTQVLNTDTQGTSTNASKIVAGDYSQLLFGIRSELRVELLRERYADTYQIGFLSHMRADVALEHPAAFVVASGLIP